MGRPAILLAVGVVALAVLVPEAAPAAPAGSVAQGTSTAAGRHRLALGMTHTCVIADDGSVWCWGNGFTARTPIDLGPGRRAATLAAGDFHTCAIIAPGTPDAGSVRCWGENRFGQLGTGTTARTAERGHPVAGPAVDLGPGRTATALAAGSNFTCALLDDAAVRCWGGNSSGQLGLGHTRPIGDDESPASVDPVDLGPGRVVALAAGGFHACAVFADGSLQCWGGNGTGELGHGNTTNLGDARRPGGAPRVFFGRGRTVVQVEAGTGTTCALLDDATVRCWGYGGAGALGLGNDESIGDDELPVTVPTVLLGGPARAIALGAYHSCALLEDGTVRCWGPNGRGELGSGDTVPIGDAATPDQGRPVALDGRAIDIASGGYQTCVLLENGTLSCWGPQDVGPLIGVALH